MKPGYKQTEVGVIPEEWECPRIRDAAAKSSNATVGGPFGSDLVSADYVDSGVPVIRGQNMSFSFITGDFVFVSEKKARSLSANLAHPNDLVFTQRGTLGQVAIVPDGSFESYLISQSQMKVSLDRSRHDPLFLHQYFTSAVGQKQIVTSAIQTGVPHTNLGILRAYRFPAPPLPEQHAIATALSDVDGLLGGLDRLIAKKRDLKQAAMQQLLTGQTRLPGFHGEWEVNTVAELEKQKLVKLSRGQVISKKDIDNTPGDFPIYSSSIHNDGLFGRYGNFMFDEELITWSVDGGGNFFHRRKHKFSVTNVCGFMRVDTSRIDYRFFAAELQLLHSRKSFDYQSKAHPSVVRKEYEVQLPPHPEQTAIAEVLTEMDGELAVLEQRREKTRALKQAMMQELLTGRTRLV